MRRPRLFYAHLVRFITYLTDGTLRWQAPELMAGLGGLTPAANCYAHGICCVEIL